MTEEIYVFETTNSNVCYGKKDTEQMRMTNVLKIVNDKDDEGNVTISLRPYFFPLEMETEVSISLNDVVTYSKVKNENNIQAYNDALENARQIHENNQTSE